MTPASRRQPPTPLPRRAQRPKFHAEAQDRISFNGKTIEYRIRRSARRKKTVEMRFEPDGLHVSAPSRASYKVIRDIVLDRAPWIVQKMAQRPLLAQPLRFVTGETLPYLGRDVEMLVEEGMPSYTAVSLKEGKFHLSVRPTLLSADRQEGIHQAFAAWYRSRAQHHIPREVERWWPRLGVKKKSRVLIGNQRSRWGSCAPDGTLRFSWRTMMLPPEVVEYIVVHELAHLSVMGHSPKFWDVVARALPDVQRRRKLLRDTGTALPL